MKNRSMSSKRKLEQTDTEQDNQSSNEEVET